MGEGDFQITPAVQHYQNISIGVKDAYIKQTISIKSNYVASEIFIGNNKGLSLILHYEVPMQYFVYILRA